MIYIETKAPDGFDVAFESGSAKLLKRIRHYLMIIFSGSGFCNTVV